MDDCALRPILSRRSIGVRTIGSSATFTGCVAIGALITTQPPSAYGAVSNPTLEPWRGIFHWLLVTHRETATTETSDSPGLSRSDSQARVAAYVDSKGRTGTSGLMSIYALSDFDQQTDNIRRISSEFKSIFWRAIAIRLTMHSALKTELEGDRLVCIPRHKRELAGGFSGFVRTASDHSILSLSPERFLRIRAREW